MTAIAHSFVSYVHTDHIKSRGAKIQIQVIEYVSYQTAKESLDVGAHGNHITTGVRRLAGLLPVITTWEQLSIQTLRQNRRRHRHRQTKVK
jgi:hypothetical protein